MSFNRYVEDNTLNLRELTNINIKDLIRFLQNKPSITRLDLYGKEIGNEGVKALAESQVLRKLTYLNLSKSNISDEGVKALAASQNLGGIEQLNLKFNKVGDEGLKFLAESQTLRKLVHLDLSCNNIGNEGLKFLAESQTLRKLVHLDLSNNNIGADGAQTIAKSQTLGKLVHLKLTCNNVGVKGVQALIESPNLKNVEEFDLGFNQIDGEGIEILAKSQYKKSRTEEERSKFELGGYQSLYNSLVEVYSKNEIINNLNENSIKKIIFNIAQHDHYGQGIKYVLTQPDKYPFLINSREDGHTLSYFYNQHSKVQKFLFEHGLIPSKEQDTELQNVVQNKQSTHSKPAVRQTNFLTKELVKSIVTNKAQLKQAADSYEKRIPLLLGQYKSNPVMLNLLSLTEQEKRSVTEETPEDYSSDDEIFIAKVAEKAIQGLKENYLTKDQDGKYSGGHTADPLQYDYKRDDAKVTIPESIGYVKLLIDRISIPLKQKKELLVTLAAQNPKLAEKKLSQIRSKLGDHNISKEQITNRGEFHKLLEKVTDSEKIDRLFSEISGLNIEIVWREQKEFVLMKQIYVAKTTYGRRRRESVSACVQGSWSQIINSVNEIDSELMNQCSEHVRKEIAREQALEKQKNAITEENIIDFAENLARKLIQYAEDNPELKEALLDFSTNVVNVEEPEKITLEQQKILAKINQEFSQNIKNIEYLPNYDRNIPKADEYKVIITALSAVQIMQNFGQKFLRSQMTEEELNRADDYESGEFQQEFLVQEVPTEPEIKQFKLEPTIVTAPSPTVVGKPQALEPKKPVIASAPTSYPTGREAKAQPITKQSQQLQFDVSTRITTEPQKPKAAEVRPEPEIKQHKKSTTVAASNPTVVGKPQALEPKTKPIKEGTIQPQQKFVEAPKVAQLQKPAAAEVRIEPEIVQPQKPTAVAAPSPTVVGKPQAPQPKTKPIKEETRQPQQEPVEKVKRPDPEIKQHKKSTTVAAPNPTVVGKPQAPQPRTEPIMAASVPTPYPTSREADNQLITLNGKQPRCGVPSHEPVAPFSGHDQNQNHIKKEEKEVRFADDTKPQQNPHTDPQKPKNNSNYRYIYIGAAVGLAIGLAAAYFAGAAALTPVLAAVSVFIGAAVFGMFVVALLVAGVDYGVSRFFYDPKCERQQQPKMQEPCIS